MKLGLYSVSYAGIWYRGEALSLPDLIRKARQLGFAGIELDGKRPHGNPMDLDAAARQEIRRVAAGEGIEIAAVASNNDFTTPVPDHLEPQILMVREQIRLAADLGSKLLRVFLAWPGVTYRADGLAHYDVARRRWEEIWRDTTRYEIWDSARAAFRELARFAESEGVVLALQNHGPVIRHHQDVIDMVREVELAGLLRLPRRAADDPAGRRLHAPGLPGRPRAAGAFARLGRVQARCQGPGGAVPVPLRRGRAELSGLRPGDDRDRL